MLFLAAKPGRVVGPVLSYESGGNIKESFDGKIYYRNAVPQGTSPECIYRGNAGNQVKSVGEERRRGSAYQKTQSPQCPVSVKPVPGMVIDVNTNPYYQPLNDRVAIDAKLLQAQSQFGAAGAAAVAVAAHRNVATVQYGLS